MIVARLGGLREHFNPRGEPKRAFPSRSTALEFIKRKNIMARIYRCGLCGQIHLSTKT